MSTELLRVYFDPAEIGEDGYPYAWHGIRRTGVREFEGFVVAVKDYIREQAGNRCERCGHPYTKGQGLNGGWSACDENCTHTGPLRWRYDYDEPWWDDTREAPDLPDIVGRGAMIEAQWRTLTVHHLNGVKHDCRWWNLAALCQRCHLTIQGKVYLDRPYDRPHTPWFRPHAAGYYASLTEPEPTREEVLARMDEILAEHATQGSLL